MVPAVLARRRAGHGDDRRALVPSRARPGRPPRDRASDRKPAPSAGDSRAVDTLSNLFAGIHLLADRPIRVGDYIRLSADDVEGHVLDVGWRSTRIRMPQNSVAVVPNTHVAESVITNFDLDSTRIGVTIRIGVSYDADPDHVERVLVEEATAAVGQVPKLLGDPRPVARLIPGFSDYSLDFTLGCQAHASWTSSPFSTSCASESSSACAPRASPCRRHR